MKQRKSVFIGLALLTALFVTVGAFAGQSARGSSSYDDQTNTTNGNMKMKKSKKSKGNSNMMNSNMMMNSNTAPNTNGTPQ